MRHMRILTALAVCLSGGAAVILAAQQPPTFRSTTRLIQVSVVVHDRNGKPVSDLTAADFTLFENGKEQPIQVFSIETDRVTPTNLTTLAPNEFSNRLDGRAGGGVSVILFDRLNTSFEDQKQARDQILKFLAQARPTDRIALYVLESDVVNVLHDFTSDASRLVRVLQRYLGVTSTELAASDTTLPDFARTGNAAEDAETEAWLTQAMQAVSNHYLRRRAELTGDALEALANHLASIRGRKNLIWVSSGFPLVIQEPLSGPQAQTRAINRATRAINNANVAVYPVDARGLIGAFTTNPGSATPVFSTLGNTRPNIDTMQAIAEATGGRAFFNTNAIGDAARRAMDDSRVSYVLGYYPTLAKWDGRFQEINVKVTRSGLDVRHRKGYLALPPLPRESGGGRTDALTDAMRSPLEATGIGLSARIDRRDGQSGEATIMVQVDARSLAWEKRGEMWEGAIDLFIAQTLSDGRFVKSLDTTVDLSATDEKHALMLQEGFSLTKQIVLRNDAHRLHVVVRDVPTRTTGSLIIPSERLRRE
jgi:VWFA-related protein